MDADEFLNLQPAQFHRLVKTCEARQRRADEMTEIMGGQIVAMVRRCGFVQFDQQLSAAEFMPSTWKKHERQRRTRKYQERVLQDWRLWRDLAKARAGLSPAP